ncbi:hypothetical protein CDD83_988 [Cordyceps sp. RAO-2017]|nr:hypothetical protein CDD83_988 [Cordyceps sp. RAO-2017]
MVSTLGGIVVAIVVLVSVAAAGWLIFAHLRARRLGIPPPSLSSYFPGRRANNQLGPPRPLSGAIFGWVNERLHKIKNRNNRSAAGAYEQSLPGGPSPGRRGFGPLDPDEAWDARVGHEADGYGYYEEQELSGTAHGRSTEYGGGGSYNMKLPSADYSGEERGRPSTRSPAGHRNPFDDDAEESLRGMSPRPIDTALVHEHKSRGRSDSTGSSPTERRSVFRENV